MKRCPGLTLMIKALLLLGLPGVTLIALIAQEPAKTTPPKRAATKRAAQAPTNAIKPQAKPAPKSPSAAAPPAGSDRVVVRFGSHKLTAADFEKMVTSLPPQYQTLARGEAKRRIAEEYAKMLVLADEARRQHLDQGEPTRTRIEFNINNMLAAAAYQKIQSETGVSDAEIQAYYDARKNEYERVHARHILIRIKGTAGPKSDKPELTEEQAKAKAEDIRKQLLAGGDFAKLAKENSDDTATAEKGGDLGYFRRGQMVAEFEKAAFALKPKEVSEPVKSAFGYHIIEVEDHSAAPVAEVQTEISRQVKEDKVEKTVKALMGGEPIFDEEYFKPATPPAVAPAPPAAPAQPPQPTPPPKP